MLRTTECVDANDFFELYQDQMERGTLEGEALEYALELLRENAMMDQIYFISSLGNLYYYLLLYRYFPEKQKEYWVIQIRRHSFDLDIFQTFSCPALRKRLEEQIGYLYAKETKRICRETKISQSIFPEDVPDELTIEALSDDYFIQSFLEKYAGNDRVKKYLGI